MIRYARAAYRWAGHRAVWSHAGAGVAVAMLPDLSQLCAVNAADDEQQKQQASVDVLPDDLWDVVKEHMNAPDADGSNVYKVHVAYGIAYALAPGRTVGTQGLQIEFRDVFPYNYLNEYGAPNFNRGAINYAYKDHPMNSLVDDFGAGDRTFFKGQKLGSRILQKHVVIQKLRESIQEAFRQTVQDQKDFKLTFSPEGPWDHRFGRQGDPYGSLPWFWITEEDTVTDATKKRWKWHNDEEVMGPKIKEWWDHPLSSDLSLTGGDSVRIEIRSVNAQQAAMQKPPPPRGPFSKPPPPRRPDMRITILESSWMFNQIAVGESPKEKNAKLVEFVQKLSDLVLGTPYEKGVLSPKWQTINLDHTALPGYVGYDVMNGVILPENAFVYEMTRKLTVPVQLRRWTGDETVPNHEDGPREELADKLRQR